MPQRVVLQAGHSAAFVPFAQGGGGAPGEAQWATDLADRIRRRLIAAGVEVGIVGAWLVTRDGRAVTLTPPTLVVQDAALFLSLHYDAFLPDRGITTGCFAGRAALDPAAAESDRFIAIWERHYVEATGIPLHKERLNPNVTGYYAFRDTTAATPGVLIEHGVGQGDDHAVLFDRLDDVAAADAAAILEFLGLPDGGNDVPLTDAQRDLLSLMESPPTGLFIDANGVRGLVEEKGEWLRVEPLLRGEITVLKEDKATLEATVAAQLETVAHLERDLATERARPRRRVADGTLRYDDGETQGIRGD